MAKELWQVMKERGVGKPPAFSSPEEMLERACEYFEWANKTVILEEKPFHFQGSITEHYVAHKRPYTQNGLCVFLGIGLSTWHDYKKKPQYSAVIKEIESVMFEQKLAGAAVGQFNANIIARDLGLAEKTEQKVQLSDDFDSLLDDAVSDDEE